ncbi:hypothetical protein N7495_009104 [Penicillium taxi]|uniref:uncharacterized protein n=1 Tax=Penicillium taxi TaxID=168475 RepID=UPI002544E230|nr:uncharacterized protein N7495_009104 [Penicillium taxi]KAJ5889063.1 hypothetical protein N7495_009104 [Penicillium taxi]
MATRLSKLIPSADAPPTKPWRKSYLRRRSALTHHKQTHHRSTARQTYTRQEQSIFADLIAQIGPKKDEEGVTPAEIETVVPSAAKSDISELLDYFKFLNKEENPLGQGSRDGLIQEEKRLSPLKPAKRDAKSTVDQLYKIRLSDLEPIKEADGQFDRYLSVREAIDYVVDREGSKIEAELFEALNSGKGDQGIWELCNERIFSMMKQLESTETTTIKPTSVPTSALTSISVSGTANDASDGSQESNQPSSSPTLNIPDILPVNHVISRLYPMVCLTAFRILGAHFPGSPLIGQFQSSLKAQGRFSAVFGTCKALYDEQIAYYWHVCQDLPALVALLHDMELVGQDPSNRVQGLLREIVQQHNIEVTKGSSPFWDLPTNKKAYEDLVRPGGLLDKIRLYSKDKRVVNFV